MVYDFHFSLFLAKMFFSLFVLLLAEFLIQIDAHVGGVNDLAFSHPNKQLCVITCGDDKTIKVCNANFTRFKCLR